MPIWFSWTGLGELVRLASCFRFLCFLMCLFFRCGFMVCYAVSLKTIASYDRFEDLVRTLRSGPVDWDGFTRARFDRAFLGLEILGKNP